MIQTTQKTMHNQTLQKWATLSNTVTRYSLSQTLMSNALQYKASKGFRYIYYICKWCWGGGGRGGVRHNFWEIWRGVRANLRLLRGGYCVIFFLARLIFRPSPPPPPIIIAQSLILRRRPGLFLFQDCKFFPAYPTESFTNLIS